MSPLQALKTCNNLLFWADSDKLVLGVKNIPKLDECLFASIMNFDRLNLSQHQKYCRQKVVLNYCWQFQFPKVIQTFLQKFLSLEEDFTIWPCLQVSMSKWYKSSCKAKRKLLQRYEGTCILFLYHFIKLKKSRLLILEKSSAGDKKRETFWQGASLNFH